jgi:hypothetical protein
VWAKDVTGAQDDDPGIQAVQHSENCILDVDGTALAKMYFPSTEHANATDLLSPSSFDDGL